MSIGLPIGPRMSRLGQPVINVEERAGIFEGVGTEELLIGKHLSDLGRGR